MVKINLNVILIFDITRFFEKITPREKKKTRPTFWLSLVRRMCLFFSKEEEETC